MSGIEVAVVGRTVTTRTTYSVKGAEPMKADYLVCTFLPAHVVIEVASGRVDYTVSGPVLKKDGTPGEARAKHRVYAAKGHSAEPEWLRELIDEASR